jgi:predicted regulator of Ras-like GTPase activity (Roadblock/LC7/MglB family)
MQHHWLETQLERLHRLAERHERAPHSDGKQARRDFREAVGEVTAEVARREGVTACFVCHDGLLVETAGRAPDFDALSAMAQQWMVAGKEAALTLSLGKVRQMVIVGEEHKLALFVIGQVAVGILSPSSVSLGRALAN